MWDCIRLARLSFLVLFVDEGTKLGMLLRTGAIAQQGAFVQAYSQTLRVKCPLLVLYINILRSHVC
jgi:hypothetical protein